MPTKSETLADQPLSTLGTTPDVGFARTPAGEQSSLDRLTGTTAEDRAALFAEAKETIGDALATALDKVKSNPRTAAAIAAGATAAVAGAAYGATRLKANGTRRPATRTATKRTPAKRAPATKK